MHEVEKMQQSLSSRIDEAEERISKLIGYLKRHCQRRNKRVKGTIKAYKIDPWNGINKS
jgi:hypothetical protein